MLQIRTSADIALPTTIKAMIYGQAGAGKTTLALSMPSPLLLDFDGGVSRVNSSHLDGVAVAQIGSWDEALDLFQVDLSPYATIVVDTAGKMMDLIIAYKCGARQPQIRDWGGINSEFNNFTRNLAQLGKNVVYIAHRDSNRDGDDMVYVPMLRAKNFTSIVSELDLLGYLEMKQINGKVERTITFNPTPRSEGKNACNLPGVMMVPTIINAAGEPTSPNNFLTEQVMAPYFGMLKIKRDTQRAYNEACEAMRAEVAAIENAEQATAFITRLDDFKGNGTLYAKARVTFAARVKELGFEYDKKNKRYV
jgi:hypothetical protein